MPSNEERREVAAKLRKLEAENHWEHGRFIVGFIDALGLETRANVGERLLHLADLIEPEERTCHIEMLDTGNEAAYEHYEYIAHCHSCHHEFGYVLYNEDGDTWQDEKPNYCPSCGARVIGG